MYYICKMHQNAYIAKIVEGKKDYVILFYTFPLTSFGYLKLRSNFRLCSKGQHNVYEKAQFLTLELLEDVKLLNSENDSQKKSGGKKNERNSIISLQDMNTNGKTKK